MRGTVVRRHRNAVGRGAIPAPAGAVPGWYSLSAHAKPDIPVSLPGWERLGSGMTQHGSMGRFGLPSALATSGQAGLPPKSGSESGKARQLSSWVSLGYRSLAPALPGFIRRAGTAA
ncbi:hypothetical protein GCM10010398_63830 [Streptomyces fimbriatus]